LSDAFQDMPPQRANARTNVGNDVKTEVSKVSVDPLAGTVSYAEFPTIFLSFDSSYDSPK